MFGNLGFGEIMLILVVLLLVFGAKRLPEIGQSLGKGIREFKKSMTDAGDSVMGPTTDNQALPPRQLDASGQAPPSSGEPKRLSQ